MRILQLPVFSVLILFGLLATDAGSVAGAEPPLPDAASNKVAPPNVLFIAVDDLRPELSCYGRSQMLTPTFEALARRSVLFERAYCMVPTCGASRASLMTSLRPTPKRFVSFTARADKDAPQAITLNTHFKQHGYTTVSLGKVFHFPDDNLHGWSRQPWRPDGSDYQDRKAEQAAIAAHRDRYPDQTKARGMPYESADAPDDAYRDHQTASQAIAHMNEFQKSGEPFFLAVGFMKPHLPFCAPKRYWDLYDHESIELPENDYPPHDAPEGAVHASGELRAYASIPPNGPVDRETARHLIHGYYACVSFIDAQLNRLLASLDENGLSDNTIIVLWGDHGWQLGEHGMWNKHSCFETSMHTPLLVSAPGFTAGTRTSALTEFIDIYPTLCELAQIPIPDHVEGSSLVPLMRHPEQAGKAAAVGRFVLGDTIRTEHFRYSEYRDMRGAGELTGRMLYDHRVDPAENLNVVDRPSLESTAAAIAEDLNRVKGKDDN